MLAGPQPDVRWRAPVLEAQGLVGDGSTREVHLGGRGPPNLQLTSQSPALSQVGSRAHRSAEAAAVA
jgi:hypothetical protein